MNNSKRPATPADKMINAVIVIVILAVLGLGAYAVYDKVSVNLETKAIQEGTSEQTVRYAADMAGMSADEYLAQYGLGEAGLNAKSTVSEMIEKMTVENYAKYSEKEVDALLEEFGLTDKATKDMLWSEADLLIPTGIYMGGEEQFAQIKEAYELDDSITAETPWGEAKDKVEEAQNAYIEKMQNATPAPTAEATEAPAEGEAEAEATEVPAEGEAEATEAPAEKSAE